MASDWSASRHVFGGASLLLVFLFGILTVRSWRVETRQVQTEATDLAVPSGVETHLAEALQVKTLTKHDPAALDSSAYRALYDRFAQAFPRIHSTLDTTHVNGLSRLYTWTGRDPSLAPIVLMAHVDVVPIEDASQWRQPPFGGRIEGGYVWGRGALDDKASAVGILQAVELLLKRGVQPRRTVHVALGHDEEVGGTRGGGALAERITAGDVSPALVLDEGGAVTRGALPGLRDPLAVVGVAGKGYLSLELTAEGPGGHSSVPPNRTSIETLNKALTRLRNHPLPSQLTGVAGTMFDYLAPEMRFPMQTVLSNRWITAPALRWMLNRRPPTRAAIRTTTVATQLEAGVKDNVIPTTARAVINFRILPTQSVADVVDHVERALEGLPIEQDVLRSTEPPSVSDVETPAFHMLQRTIGQVTADSVVVAPYLVPGRTDSGYYAEASNAVYRFVPYVLTPEDQSRIHGPNERISVTDYRTIVRFYMQVVRNAEALADQSHRDLISGN